MLLFKDIYNKAVNLFDDPIIQKAYVEDTVRWEKLMYPYLQNGVALFVNPTKIAYLLIDQTPPQGKFELFEGNGTDTYTLSTTPIEDSDFSFTNNTIANFFRLNFVFGIFFGVYRGL